MFQVGLRQASRSLLRLLFIAVLVGMVLPPVVRAADIRSFCKKYM